MFPPPQKHPLLVAFVGVAVFATLLPSVPANAAGLLPALAGAANEATTEPTGPEIIAATEIPVRADADERLVQEITQRARQQDPTAALVPQLSALANGVANLAALSQKEEVSRIPVVRLESLERHWKFYADRLESWRGDLERHTSAYSADAAALSSRRATWEATRAVEGLAPALATRAGSIAAQIDQAEQIVSGPLGAQLQLGRKANALQGTIDQGLKAVGLAVRRYDQRLLRVDEPSLWEIPGDPKYASEDAVAAARIGLGIETQFLGEYVAAHKHRLLAIGVAALLLLPLLLWLGRRGRDLVSDDPKLNSSAHLLKRPLSAWLVVTLVSIPIVLPEAPLIVHQVALLLAVIPVLRLLPADVYRALGPTPYLATGLYLFSRLGFLLIGHSLYFRLHLLAVSALALFGMVWLLVRRPTQIVAPKTLTAGVWRFLGFVAVGALGVAIFANLLGNVSLADVLTGAVVVSSYVGLALNAGAYIVGSMLRLLLARKSVTRLRVVTQRTGPLLRALGRLTRLGALVIWILVTLNAFRVLRPVTSWLKSVLTYPLEAGHISVTLGSILLFALSVWIAFWFARSIRAVLQDDVLPKMELPRGVGNSISTLTYYAMVTAGLLIALAAAGFETGQFTIIFGALSVGIGFGLQNVVNNFVSGLILMFERPIQPGDVVEISGTSGTVREIGMRATMLTTFDGADVVVPNGTLLSEKLVNWTLRNTDRRIDVDIGVAYGSDPRRVMELLKQVATSTPGVSATPPPAVIFLRFGASSLDFGVRAWTNNFDEWASIRSVMTASIYDALRDEGIEMQQALHLRSVSPDPGAQLGLAPGQGAGPGTQTAT